MSAGLVIVVTGGRRYADRAKVFAVLDEIDASERGPIALVIDGHCQVYDEEKGWVDSGADRWANEWALERARATERYPADWKRFGPSAGPRRNHVMALRNPGLVVAFPGDRGTAGMVKICRARQLEVFEVAA